MGIPSLLQDPQVGKLMWGLEPSQQCENFFGTIIIQFVCYPPSNFKLCFSSMWTKNFQMYKLDLEKAEEPEIKLPTSTGS